MSNLKQKLLQLLQDGNQITVTWDCGYDEAIVVVFINEENIEDENNKVIHDEETMYYGNKEVLDDEDRLTEELSIYLANYLNLPDVGEFEMEGRGELIEESDDIYIHCESIMKAYMDYGECGEKEEWIECNEKEDNWSGKIKLFD
jgi:hypothetical protein